MSAPSKEDNIRQYFEFARERHRIYLKKEAGEPKPWTEGEVFQQYRFCCVHRELDKVTQWFRQNIRDPLKDSDDVVFATIVFRLFNLPSTGEILLREGMLTEWDRRIVRSILHDKKPLITAAYMLKSPAGMTKLEGMIQILDPIWEDRENLIRDIKAAGTLQGAHERLMVYPYIGGFLAYEFVTDLNYTSILKDAPDKMTWANPGPGASRGIARLLYNDPNAKVSAELALNTMRELTEYGQNEEYWPREYGQWDARNSEHWLCETDKILRFTLGEGTPKQKYNGR